MAGPKTGPAGGRWNAVVMPITMVAEPTAQCERASCALVGGKAPGHRDYTISPTVGACASRSVPVLLLWKAAEAIIGWLNR